MGDAGDEVWRDRPDGPGAFWVRWPSGGGAVVAQVYRGGGRLPGQEPELWAGNARTVPVSDPYYHGARWLRLAEPGYPPGSTSPCGAVIRAAGSAARAAVPTPITGVFVQECSRAARLRWADRFDPPARLNAEGSQL